MWKYESDLIKLFILSICICTEENDAYYKNNLTLNILYFHTHVCNLSYPGKQVIFLKQYYLIEKFCRAGVTTQRQALSEQSIEYLQQMSENYEVCAHRVLVNVNAFQGTFGDRCSFDIKLHDLIQSEK